MTARLDAIHCVFAFMVGVLFIAVPIVLADIAEIRANRRRRWRTR